MTVSRAPDSARTLYSPEATGQDHWNSCPNAYSPGDLINSFQLQEPWLPRLGYQKCTTVSGTIHILLKLCLVPLPAVWPRKSHCPSPKSSLLTMNEGLYWVGQNVHLGFSEQMEWNVYMECCEDSGSPSTWCKKMPNIWYLRPLLESLGLTYTHSYI